MKQTFALTFFAFSVLWSSSCGEQTKFHYAKETKVLQNYLRRTYDKKIDSLLHFYFFVPGDQCPNCNIYTSTRIDPKTNRRLTIITDMMENNFTGFHVLRDSTGSVLTLPFLNYSNKLVITENREIISIIAVRNLYKQLDSLTKHFGN